MPQSPERPDRASASGTPGWVKAFGIAAVVLLLLLIAMLLLGGEHGPGRHLPSSDPAGHTARIERAAAWR